MIVTPFAQVSYWRSCVSSTNGKPPVTIITSFVFPAAVQAFSENQETRDSSTLCCTCTNPADFDSFIVTQIQIYVRDEL